MSAAKTAGKQSTGAADCAKASVHDSLVLTAKYLPIVAPFLSKFDPRYYLKGLNVRPLSGGGVTICATNGQILGVFRDPDGICLEEVTLLIGTEVLAACAVGIDSNRKVVLRNGRLTVIDGSGNDICIQAGNPVVDPSKPYPRFEKVVPPAADLLPGLMGVINAPLLMKLNAAAIGARKASGMHKSYRDYHGLTFFNVAGDGNKCTVARLDFDADFLAIIMPLRAENDISVPLPSWLQDQRVAA